MVSAGNQYNAASDNAPRLSFSDLIKYLRKGDNEWDTFSFRELIRNLRSYSLLQEPSRRVYSIHPLIHSWARDRMTQTEQESMKADAIQLLFFSLPDLNSSNVMYLQTLLPHLDFYGHPTDMDTKNIFGRIYFICGREKDALALWS